ncbi:MAG: hypothetical protein AB9866_31035 [Syntrophobacteraceae bacterium]
MRRQLARAIIALLVLLTSDSSKSSYCPGYPYDQVSEISDVMAISVQDIGVSRKRGKSFVISDKDEIANILRRLKFEPHSAMPCGFDFWVVLHRETDEAATMQINTDCGYFTSTIPETYDIQTDSSFYSFSGPIEYALSKYMHNIENGNAFIHNISCTDIDRCIESRSFFNDFKHCTVLPIDSMKYEIACDEFISDDEREALSKVFLLDRFF